MTPSANTPGFRLRQLRVNLRLTQVDLARKIGVSQSVISDMEQNRYGNPSASLIAALANALTTSPQYILTGEGPAQAATRLTEPEHDLLATFRLLEPRDQARLLAQARVLLDVDAPSTDPVAK